MTDRTSQELPPPHAVRRIFCVGCGFSLDIPVDCSDRFCSVCAPRRAFRVRNRLRWILANTKPPPGYMLKMITLSVANCAQLDEGVRHLVKSFRRLRQRGIWKDFVQGGATIIEIKGRPNDWHPHLHILCYSRWIDWYKLQPAWKSVSNGQACFIQNVSGDQAMIYVTKYITKSELPEFLEYDVGISLRKYRLFQRFGSWHSLRVPKRLYDYACPNCNRSDWLLDRPDLSAPIKSGRSPPTSKVTPRLSDDDLSWRCDRIWNDPSHARRSARGGELPGSPIEPRQ